MTLKLTRLAILFYCVGHSILNKNYFNEVVSLETAHFGVLTDQVSVGTGTFPCMHISFYSRTCI